MHQEDVRTPADVWVYGHGENKLVKLAIVIVEMVLPTGVN